jgi:SAM-dependent methyltransferase
MDRGSPPPSDGQLLLDHPWVEEDLARLYDAFPFEDDVPFYLELAARQGPRVLELGCGTGRLLEPLARAGCEVVGIDSSPHMLSLARSKLDVDGHLSSRCRLVEGDIRDFDVGERFDLGIIAVRSLSYLTSREDQQAALARARDHLRPGGLLAIDLLHPRLAWLSESPGRLHHDLVQRLPSGEVLTRTECVVTTDLATQLRVIRSTYDLVDRDGMVRRRLVEWPLRFIYRYEGELLLEAAGFEVEDVYGGYRREPLASDSSVMMLLARAPHDGAGRGLRA